MKCIATKECKNYQNGLGIEREGMRTPIAMYPRHGWKRIAIIGFVILGVVVAGVWTVPRIIRESRILHDQEITLGSDRVRVVMVMSENRSIFMHHVFIIGGGDKRYDTTITYPSGQKIIIYTLFEPCTLWMSHGHLFIEGYNIVGDSRFTGEIVNGQVVPMARSSLPEPPPIESFLTPFELAQRKAFAK